MTKAVVAVIVSALELAELATGWSSSAITPEWIEATLMILSPILVWLVPNDWIGKRFVR